LHGEFLDLGRQVDAARGAYLDARRAGDRLADVLDGARS
jgi:hypothetical protein